jgi:predicted metal-binding membrane protein
MWVVMMVAMMLPSLVPMLWRYRQAVGSTGEARLARLTAFVGVGYFSVWTVFGMAAFRWASRWRRSRCSSRRWRAPFRSRSAGSS